MGDVQKRLQAVGRLLLHHRAVQHSAQQRWRGLCSWSPRASAQGLTDKYRVTHAPGRMSLGRLRALLAGVP